jgi:molybdopterin-synthase adenylyltransferase
MKTISSDFSEVELQRYERQIRIDGFGIAAQLKLKSSAVFISRVGGVGGTAAMNLARAGIGKLVLAHGGSIVPEYLNRMQVVLPEDVGRLCIEVWVERLRQINPAVEIFSIAENVNEANVAGLMEQADLVIDGAPLFEERYAMNREAVRQGKPICMGAMYSTEGYVTTIVPGETPCLTCLYPEKPDYWTNVKVFPAIGPGPVIIGATVAMEAIKVLTGFGQPLKNTLAFFDLETNATKHLKVKRRPGCPVCGGIHREHMEIRYDDRLSTDAAALA